MKEMRETWKVLVAPEDRPTGRKTTGIRQPVQRVTLRDAGRQIALIDGSRRSSRSSTSGYVVHQPDVGLGSVSVRGY